MKNLIKGIYIFLGMLALIIGAIGAALPILPTTPFLLLALYCFAKGSKRWHDWFVGTKLYKSYLEDFVQKRAMTLKQKISILLFADFMLLFPLILLSKPVKLFIVMVILFKYYYFLFKIKTISIDNNEGAA